MVDIDTFLTELYIVVDDFGKAHLPIELSEGHPDALARSEVVTVTLFSTWFRFRSQRDFYAWAGHHLRSAFPDLPDRSQFNRLQRRHREAILAVGADLEDELTEGRGDYEALDGFGVAVRNAKRRGSGWLAGQANIGWSNRLGWYEGFNVLTAVHPTGALTGLGFGPASTKDQVLAETFLAARRFPQPGLPNVGEPTTDLYFADKGFEGAEYQRRWHDAYGATVTTPPTRQQKAQWPTSLRRWVAGLRQIAETAHQALLDTFSLARERPHALDGFQARLYARVALYHFCMWLNRKHGRPLLTFADLIDW